MKVGKGELHLTLRKTNNFLRLMLQEILSTLNLT